MKFGRRVFLGTVAYPVVESAAINSAVASLGQFREDTVNASVFGGNNPKAVRVCDRAGWQ